eukprot:TRINITY_DN7126_c0_g2_i1.p1 TRINITY_DN7126_c0_g2~~TRINITY_DN7126_c0_g2_i1.p1  ORF type:complete len:350 (+),score=110.76 TRINITY_DN7126_c0_g2_i1:49-1050(+)
MMRVLLLAAVAHGLMNDTEPALPLVNVSVVAAPAGGMNLSSSFAKLNESAAAKLKKSGKDLALKLRREMEKKIVERYEEKVETKKAAALKQSVAPVVPKRDLEEEEENEQKYYSKGDYESITTNMVSTGTTYNVHSVQAKMDRYDGEVLLLHGNAYTHTIWKDIETMDRIREAGFRPTSVDLPGKGLSYPLAPVPVRGQWLVDYINEMKIKNPIVVAPSMSGTYALPVLLNYPGTMKALVAIAPSGALKVQDEQWKNVTVPVSIMFGANDPLAYVAAATMFRTIPLASRWKVANGTHAFYVTRGAEFNKRLVKFIKKVHSSYFVNKAAEKKSE